MRIPRLLTYIAKNDKGATAIEYGLIIALIALSALTAIQVLSEETTSMWNGIEEKSSTAISKNGQ